MTTKKAQNYILVRLEANAQTLAELEQIEISCFGGERWDKKMLADTVNSGVCHAFGVREAGVCGVTGVSGLHGGGRLVASMIFSVAADMSELLTLAVLPDARRRGISERLLEHWQSESAARGAKKLFLEVNTQNSAAIALYQKHGFSNVGRRSNYYIKSEYPSNDAFVFAKILD